MRQEIMKRNSVVLVQQASHYIYLLYCHPWARKGLFFMQKTMTFLDPRISMNSKILWTKNANVFLSKTKHFLPKDDTSGGTWKSLAILILFTGTLLTSMTLHAQDNSALVVDLINRVGAVEAENRELRGQLEEAHHQMNQLTQKMETLSADVDYRLSNPESGAMIPPPPSPLGGEGVSREGSSSAEDEYERARALLEQGDYPAAEHAFSAFVSAHAKHDLAGAAQYWLGVTHFVRGEHEKAAATFAKGYKAYPKSSKAPDTLLKLAKSLAALNRNSDACATLDQLTSEYPKKLVKDVTTERKKLSCK